MEIKFDGIKTYVVGVALICYAVGGLVAGKIDINAAIQAGLTGLGLMGIRHGISTAIKSIPSPDKPETVPK